MAPAPASRTPGVGEVAGETIWLAASGKPAIWPSADDPVAPRSTGSSTTATAATTTNAQRRAAADPASTASNATDTATPGHADCFSTAAAPRTSPAGTGWERAASTSPKHSSPATGRSWPPTAAGSATTGHASTAHTSAGGSPSSAAAGLARATGGPACARAMAAVRAAVREPRNTAKNHSRASPRRESPSSWRGSPKTAIPGR